MSHDHAYREGEDPCSIDARLIVDSFVVATLGGTTSLNV